MNGFPFAPGSGVHGGHLPLPPQHRPPFYPRISDDFTLRQNSLNQVNLSINMEPNYVGDGIWQNAMHLCHLILVHF